MSTPTQQRVMLPASVLASAKAISADRAMAPSARLAGVLMLVYGWAWYEQQSGVVPQDIQLPEAQWLELCGYLTSGVPDDAIAAVNLGLSFMNAGPSSYKD